MDSTRQRGRCVTWADRLVERHPWVALAYLALCALLVTFADAIQGSL